MGGILVFSLKDEEIGMMNKVAELIDPDCEFDRLGSWGITHLACGAIYGQTQLGAGVAFLGLPSEYDIFKYQLNVSMADEMIALVFSNYIKLWSIDKNAQKLIRQRLNSMNRNMTEEQYLYYHYYLTLSLMLNSMNDLSSEDDFNKVKRWVELDEFGWEKVFFGAGLILTNDNDFYWERYVYILKSLAGNNKDEVAKLYEYFERK